MSAEEEVAEVEDKKEEKGKGNKEGQSSSKAQKPSPSSPPHRVVEVEKGKGNKEEQSSHKAQKPSPRSPPHPAVGEEEGEGKEGWPALPSPGGKVGPQVPILTPGSQKTPSPPKGPENQPQPTSSQEAHKAEGLKSGLQKPGLSGKGPLSSWRTTKHSEEDSASKGTPQKGPNSGGQIRVTKETSKPLGPHLKAPQPRPQGPLAKGDSKVANKAKQ